MMPSNFWIDLPLQADEAAQLETDSNTQGALEPPAVHHITLAYFGPADQYTLADYKNATSVLLERFARTGRADAWRPADLLVYTHDLGYWPVPDCYYLNVDSYGLRALRKAVVEAVKVCGLTPTQKTSWTPHVTLRNEGGPAPSPPSWRTLRVGQIRVTWGDLTSRYPLRSLSQITTETTAQVNESGAPSGAHDLTSGVSPS